MTSVSVISVTYSTRGTPGPCPGLIQKAPPPGKKEKQKHYRWIVKQFTFLTKWQKFRQSEARQLILPYTAVTASGLSNSARVTELTYQ